MLRRYHTLLLIWSYIYIYFPRFLSLMFWVSDNAISSPVRFQHYNLQDSKVLLLGKLPKNVKRFGQDLDLCCNFWLLRDYVHGQLHHVKFYDKYFFQNTGKSEDMLELEFVRISLIIFLGGLYTWNISKQPVPLILSNFKYI